LALPPFEFHAHHLFDKNGKKETIDTLFAGPARKVWDRALSKEFGHLAQGIDDRVVATDTIDFIHKSDVPSTKIVTYGNCSCDYRPLKSEPYRVCLTVGGDKLPYDADSGSPTASLLETQLVINSTISDSRRGARFLSADLKDHFLASPMQHPEYMKIRYKYFPADIRKNYKLWKFVTADGNIYIWIKKGMYGLNQAALLAYQHLVKQLAP
jgi:hypothetical protein